MSGRKGCRHVVGEDRQVLAKEFVKRYIKGESIRALASSTGWSYGFVHRVLTESGVRLRLRGYLNGSRPWTDGEVRALKELVARRWSPLQIGYKLGRTPAAVETKISVLRRKGAFDD